MSNPDRTPTHRKSGHTITLADVFRSRDRNRDRTPTHRGAYRNG